ncbi:hypothetical protein [Paenibacillus tepidiphilus]|uniref:hypothetical protein n=1 Tax=Paenibacillus tepidiphilus TaxID=2608683 RepID=UPI00123A675D|nr:hypothetical protein [Paenibacillus tepidiphilus]
MFRLKPIYAMLAVILLLVGCSSNSGGNAAASLTPAPTASEQNTAEEAVPDTATAAPSGQQASPGIGSEAPGAAATPTGTPAITVAEPATLQPVFGFADSTGVRILATWANEKEDAERLGRIDTAIGSNGLALPVKPEGWQPGTDNSNGRDLALNLENLPGQLFTVENGGAVPDDTYMLVNSAEFNLAALLPIQPAGPEGERIDAGSAAMRSIAAAKQREIQAAWKLASLPEERPLYLVQFVREDKSMLFSLVVQDGKDLIFMDYPAVIQDNEYSVWRVDDGGEVLPQMFSLLFAAETIDGLLLGVNWRGAEGINSFLLVQEGQKFKELEPAYSRYTSPL